MCLTTVFPNEKINSLVINSVLYIVTMKLYSLDFEFLLTAESQS